MLLARSHAPRLETVNDKDCYLANFWRAVQHDPEAVACHADWPINEADLHARHRWLVDQADFRERMKTDPEYFDVRIAGWWVWGISMWIGSGWCERPDWEGRGHAGRAARGISVKPHIANGGQGVNAVSVKRPHISSRSTGGVHYKKPRLNYGGGSPTAVSNIGAVPTTEAGQGRLTAWMLALAERLRYVRVCCGDWTRVVTPSVTFKISGDKMPTGILLDPPYDLRQVRGKEHDSDGATPSDKLYTHHDNDLSADVREWAIENGENPLLRIALCGYEGEHEMPGSWECIHWKANGGYANQRGETKGKENAKRERIWFSPHCLRVGLFQ